MAKLIWYARQMDSCTSKQSSRQCQDRWSSPRAAQRHVCVTRREVNGTGKKHLTFIPLFIPNFRSFREILEIQPGTTNHHNEFAISIFGVQNTPRVCLRVRRWGAGDTGGGTRQRRTKSCENHYLWCSCYIIIAVPLEDRYIYIFTLILYIPYILCMIYV